MELLCAGGLAVYIITRPWTAASSSAVSDLGDCLLLYEYESAGFDDDDNAAGD
jgi:hypothetical protein